MPEIRRRNFRVVLHVEEPSHLSEHDELKSISWERSARDLVARLQSVADLDVLGARSVEIVSDVYAWCPWCGNEIDPKADAPCCELAADEYVNLQVKVSDPSAGVTPQDVIRAIMQNADAEGSQF
jgi:hypothetical protein